MARCTDLAMVVDGRKERRGKPGYCCDTRDFLQLYCIDTFVSAAEMQPSGIDQGARGDCSGEVSKGSLLLP